MAIMSEEVKKAIGEFRPALVATADRNGMPNVSIKGSFQVLDDEHVVFVDMRSPRTTNNLKENPYVSATGFNASTRKGWRIWGKAELKTSGELFENLSKKFASMGVINHVVVVNIQEALIF